MDDGDFAEDDGGFDYGEEIGDVIGDEEDEPEEEEPEDEEEEPEEEPEEVEEEGLVPMREAIPATGAPAGQQRPCPNPQRRTIPRLSKFEVSRLIGIRAKQLDNYNPNAPTIPGELRIAGPMVDIGDEIDSVKIATMELKAKKFPLKVRRYLPDGSCEDWTVEELENTYL